MADHTVATEAYYDGAWQDIPVYHRDGIVVVRGAQGEGQEAPPTSVTMTIDDRTRAYSPGNVASALYGKIGRNTPVRVTLDGSVRATVEASSLAPDQGLGADPDAWVAVDAGGILRRLQQGKTPLRSAFERAILASNPLAYWPLTEGKDATALLSSTGGEPLEISGIRPGEVAGPSGSGAAFPDVASVGPAVRARGPLPTGIPGTGWGMECLVYIGRPVVVGETPDLPVVQFDVGRGDPWRIFIGEDSSSGPYVIVTAWIGATDASMFTIRNVAYGWHHVRILAWQNGANVELRLYVDGSNTSNAGGNQDSRTIAGSLGGPAGDLVIGQAEDLSTVEYMDAAAVGQVAFYALADATDHSDAAFGYLGELAGVRFLRVLAEEGVAAVVVGDENDTQPMGAQPLDTLLNIVRECVRTDAGMLFEPADQVALAMRTGRSLLNQDPLLELSWTDPGIGPPLRPRYDDRIIFNDVTVRRRNGGEARAVQTSGPLNVSDPIDDPDGVGRVDTSIDVNTETDDVLPVHAGWHLSRGTVPDARYPQIVVDLDAAPSLGATIAALEVGDALSLADLPAAWALEPVRLLLVGVQDRMPASAGHRRRLVTLVTTPAAPYEILQVGDGTIDLRGMRVHTTSSTVNGSHVAADTTIVIDSAGIEWTTNADNWDPAKNGGGMFLELAGEVVRVTGIAGAGSAWTLTVVRAVNGVSKTIPDGTPVRFKYPGRIAL